jgi:hypothetical protein
MRFAVPPWPAPKDVSDHPFFGKVINSQPNLETDLDRAYMAPDARADRDGGRRKLSKRDEKAICLLIQSEALNRKQCADLYEVSEKTIQLIVYGAGLRFPRRTIYKRHPMPYAERAIA